MLSFSLYASGPSRLSDQHEPSGVNHRIGRSRSGILMRTVPIIGFPDLLVNIHLAIRRQYGISNQARSHLSLMSFKLLWLLLRTSLQGYLARAHQPAKEWQRLGHPGNRGPSEYTNGASFCYPPYAEQSPRASPRLNRNVFVSHQRFLTPSTSLFSSQPQPGRIISYLLLFLCAPKMSSPSGNLRL